MYFKRQKTVTLLVLWFLQVLGIEFQIKKRNDQVIWCLDVYMCQISEFDRILQYRYNAHSFWNWLGFKFITEPL